MWPSLNRLIYKAIIKRKKCMVKAWQQHNQPLTTGKQAGENAELIVLVTRKQNQIKTWTIACQYQQQTPVIIVSTLIQQISLAAYGSLIYPQLATVFIISISKLTPNNQILSRMQMKCHQIIHPCNSSLTGEEVSSRRDMACTVDMLMTRRNCCCHHVHTSHNKVDSVRWQTASWMAHRTPDQWLDPCDQMLECSTGQSR